MAGVVSRGLSLLVVAGYLVAGLLSEQPPPPVGRSPGPRMGPAGEAMVAGAILLLPLALIWFPDVIGGYIGSVGRGGYVDRETPPVLIVLAGWFFLVGIPAISYFVWRSNG